MCGKPPECVSVKRFIRCMVFERSACAAGLENAQNVLFNLPWNMSIKSVGSALNMLVDVLRQQA
jgi:hypothetical protein